MISSLQFGQGGVFLAELMGKISLRFGGFKYWSDFVTTQIAYIGVKNQ